MTTPERHEPTFVCPACGADLLVPERDEIGFNCEVCGVHLLRRGRHIHLEWDHREVPVPGPHERPHRVVGERPVQGL
jgi:hypothetical protein